MTRLVVFDLDGTLVDSGDQIVAAMRTGYAAVGHPPPAKRAILSIVGISLPQAVERLSPALAVDVRDKIVAEYRAAFFANTAKPPLYPGARQTLEALSDRVGLKLAVATGKARRGLLKVLDQHGLGPFFNSLHAGDEHPSKPDPAMLRAAMAAAGASAAETVMVGDSVFDIEMAVAAGVDAIAVGWGYGTPAELTAAGARVTLADFGELTRVIPEVAAL